MSLPSDPAARELAQQVLAGRDYARYRVDEAAWLSFFDQLAAWLEAIERWFDGLSIDSPFQAGLIYVGLLLVSAVLLTHVIWSIRQALAAPSPAVDRPQRRSPQDRARDAAGLAAAGRYLDAARMLQIACLELLVERGDLELRRADANSVLRRRLARSALPAPQRRTFLTLLDTLEANVFRDGDDDPQLYESWRVMHEGLRSGAIG